MRPDDGGVLPWLSWDDVRSKTFVGSAKARLGHLVPVLGLSRTIAELGSRRLVLLDLVFVRAPPAYPFLVTMFGSSSRVLPWGMFGREPAVSG
jgi:hypothetical protein